ncbi:MAG: response regulator [bacterium]
MKRILIIDDDKDMRGLYEMFFSDQTEKYEVEIQSDATVALERVKDSKFDLIILDIIMEPMFGDSFFLYLRGEESTMRVPVLVVSVLGPDTMGRLKRIDHVDTIDKPRTLDFLQKPVTKEQLLCEVDRMLLH